MSRRASVQSMCATLGEIKGNFPVLAEKHSTPRRILIAMVALFCFASTLMAAQTASFSGGQSTVGSGLNVPLGAAIDAAGNVYIADSGNGRILKETLSAGSFTQSIVVASGLSNPSDVAVDGAGNVYIADTNNNRVLEETPSASGYTQSTVATGLNAPRGLAVDATGDVYIADTANNRVLKETLSAGSYTQSTVVSGTSYTPLAVVVDATGNVYILGEQNLILKETLSAGSYTESTIPATGLVAPAGIAVDVHGNVYVTDSSANAVLKETLSAGTYTQSTLIGSSLSNPYGVAVDGNGNVYIADSQDNRVVWLQTAAENFGIQAIGSRSQVVSTSFAFLTGGTIASPLVLTQGKAGLDFADAGTGTCTTNGTSYTYAAGDSCTVNLTFTPTYAGGRSGAVELLNNSGSVMATGYVYGIGAGPQRTYSPGTQSTVLGSGLSHLMNIAVDASGNLYFVDIGNNRVLKETFSGGAYTQSIVATGLISPLGVAVDGAGNVFIADSGHGRVLEETPSGSSYTQSAIVASSLYDPYAVAVDGAGNVYIADTYNARVLKETPSASGYIQSTVGTGLGYPRGVAVDVSGNVYIADSSNKRVLKETRSAAGYTQSVVLSGTSYNPNGIAVDANGNIYLMGNGSLVLEETPSGSSYIESTVPTSGLSAPAGTAVDGAGNIYITDYNLSIVVKEDIADTPIVRFTTSALAPQTVTLSNIGNESLTFQTPSSGNNPSASSGFALASNSTCPQLSSTSAPGVLAPDSSCTDIITTAFAGPGILTGSLGILDNNLNVLDATQTITLAAVSPTTLVFAPISTHKYGDAPFTVSATSASTGPVTYTVVSGPATISGNMVTLTGGGQVQLSATQAATTYYPVLTAQITFAVNTRASETMTFSSTSTAVSASPGSDTPNYLFLDTNGMFYLQNAYSQYDTAPGDHIWDFYTGVNAQDPNLALSAAHSIYNTQPMCETGSPVYTAFYGIAGRTPGAGAYADGNFCDVIGVWVDPDTGNWYGIVHNELYPNAPRMDAISYAISTNQGNTWTMQAPILTSPYGVGDNSEFYYYYGDGDPRLIVDTASGYFYVFYFSRIMTPSGAGFGSYNWEHVARAPISQKMAPASWEKYYNGTWSQTLGVDWTCDPATTTCGTGQTSASMESNIGADGDPVIQQTMVQPISKQTANDLSTYGYSGFTNTNVAWDVYLQKYVAEVVGGNQILFYVSNDLAGQKWTYAGGVPYSNGGAWYWWMVDAANLTSTNNLGKTFLAYCTVACSTYGSEYVPVTVSLDAGAASPAYYSSADGRRSRTDTYAIQHAKETRSFSCTKDNKWKFVPTDDGYFYLEQERKYLQVAGGNAGRAWGASVSLAAPISSTLAPELARQQWRFEEIKSKDGKRRSVPQYRLINRYSGLALSFSGKALDAADLSNAVTAPIRDWEPSSTTTYKTWHADDQELIFVPQ